MALLLKILAAVLILVAGGMGLKQSWAMLSGQPAMLAQFARWQIGAGGVAVLGGLTMLGAVLLLPPPTFLWGNFLMASVILFLMAEHAWHRDLRGLAIELPFLALSLLLLYLQHPLAAPPK